MLIDWFTVVAQVVNFTVLVWLMKRFLYKPVLHAIDAREQRIAAELADTEVKRTEAERERVEYQHKNAEFDQLRAGLLSKATEAATAERQRLLGEVRQAAELSRANQQETLRNDARDLNRAIGRRTRAEVFAIARKALKDLASSSLEDSMCEEFTRRLRAMDRPVRDRLGEAMKAAPGSALVRSAFDLAAEQRAVIQKALDETFSAEVHARFETAPDLIGGIELACDGQKVGWSIDDYLVSLEKSVGELLSEPVGSEHEIEPDAVPVPEGEVDEEGA